MGDSGTSTAFTRCKAMRLRSLRQSERTTASNPAQHMRWIYQCSRGGKYETSIRWTRWWYWHLPNIWYKVINKGGVTILKVHKCCTPVDKTMSEISNCCHYFLSNHFLNWLFIIALTARSYRDCHWFSVWEWCLLLIYRTSAVTHEIFPYPWQTYWAVSKVVSGPRPTWTTMSSGSPIYHETSVGPCPM